MMGEYKTDPQDEGLKKRERARIAREVSDQFPKHLWFVWYAPIKTASRETSPQMVDFLKRLFPDTCRKVYLVEK